MIERLKEIFDSAVTYCGSAILIFLGNVVDNGNAILIFLGILLGLVKLGHNIHIWVRFTKAK